MGIVSAGLEALSYTKATTRLADLQAEGTPVASRLRAAYGTASQMLSPFLDHKVDLDATFTFADNTSALAPVRRDAAALHTGLDRAADHMLLVGSGRGELIQEAAQKFDALAKTPTSATPRQVAHDVTVGIDILREGMREAGFSDAQLRAMADNAPVNIDAEVFRGGGALAVLGAMGVGGNLGALNAWRDQDPYAGGGGLTSAGALAVGGVASLGAAAGGGPHVVGLARLGVGMLGAAVASPITQGFTYFAGTLMRDG